jgi:hypothetical protein
MSKLWLSLGIISLLGTAAIVLDQGLRFSVWWEWEDFIHHETFSGILLCIALVFIIVALVENLRKPGNTGY